MKKQKTMFLALNSIIPLVVGVILYYLISPETIFVKIIDRIIGRDIHNAEISMQNRAVRFIRFYFMDMCWAYAMTFSLNTILGNNTANIKKSCLLAIVFATLMELLQLTPLAKGTFDVIDILCEVLAIGIAVFIIKKFMGGNEK